VKFAYEAAFKFAVGYSLFLNPSLLNNVRILVDFIACSWYY